MTPTMTDRRLDSEQIQEIQNALADVTMESCYFKGSVHNSEDSLLLKQFSDSLVVGYNIREFKADEAEDISNKVQLSDLFRWWCGRVNIAIRSTSIDPAILDEFVINALDFPTYADTQMSYTKSDASADDFRTMFAKYPFVRVIAYWHVFRIPFQMKIWHDDPDKEDGSDKDE